MALHETTAFEAVNQRVFGSSVKRCGISEKPSETMAFLCLKF